MGMNNIELYNLAKSFLGWGGSTFRKYCGLSSGDPWCCAFVRYIFDKGRDSLLFYNGKNVVYVPNAERWLFANYANIPIYLAMPMDVVTFNWDGGLPDHIGFVRERKSDTTVLTIEGNTSGGIVANRERPAKYISGCFRIGFAPSSSWNADKQLVIDGQFGYNSIAVLQKVLKKKGCYADKVDAILGKNTVKGIQKLLGLAQDGSWGVKTSKALQKYLGVTADGWFGEKSVKALQKWLNKQNTAQPKTIWDKANAWAIKIANDNRYGYVRYTDDAYTHECCICHPRGHHFGWNCIGYAWAIWHHGAGLPNRCSCEVINNSMADRLLKMKASDALEFVQNRIGIKSINVYRTAKYFPVENLKKGDIILFYDGWEYYHTAYYMGDGKMADARSTRGIVAGYAIDSDMKPDIKCVIRYTGKVAV